MSTVELQIAERARKFKGEALTNLQQFITVPMLEECFSKLNRGSSAGVDGKLWSDYDLERSERLP
ncbi:MAG: hypothetical protein PF541_01070 [Prolixibacteraceae bacterium]|jgi:RNA-directed DNA polymerase|nr:hypothetical protein [Prolixibacteraceae bacterium]